MGLDAQHRKLVITMPRRGAFFALWLVALLPGIAGAWGAEGHRIVGAMAEDLLDARTRAAVRELAGGESLADVATWMDEERPRLQYQLPGSAAWHYEDIPVCGPRGEPSCPQGNCASKALQHYRTVLADRHASAAERLLALRIVVHLVGDIHQPLHLADNGDRGGNEIVLIGRESARPGRWDSAGAGGSSHGRNLHSAWDVDFVRRAVHGETDAQFVANLIAEHSLDRRRIEAGTPADWMAESHRIAQDFAYGRLPGFACGHRYVAPIELSSGYREEATRIVRERLADAGIRLAVVLQAALEGP